MITEKEFIQAVVSQAQLLGYKIEHNRKGLVQIDFGHKKLHENHLKALYPRILNNGTHIGELIESVAPGRPCIKPPMREIIAAIKQA